MIPTTKSYRFGDHSYQIETADNGFVLSKRYQGQPIFETSINSANAWEDLEALKKAVAWMEEIRKVSQL